MKKIYNIGVIGFGSRARAMWRQSFKPYGETEGNNGFRLVAITDVRPEEDIPRSSLTWRCRTSISIPIP